MISKWQVVIGLVAVTGSAALLVRQQRYAKQHWSNFMVGDPHIGAQLFFEKEGCAHCHAVNGVGADLQCTLRGHEEFQGEGKGHASRHRARPGAARVE